MTSLQYPYKYQSIPTIHYDESNNEYKILNNTEMGTYVDLDSLEKTFYDELVSQLKTKNCIQNGVNSYLITWNKNGEYISSLNIYYQTNKLKYIMLQAQYANDELLGIYDDVPMIRGSEYVKRAQEIDDDAYTFGINENVQSNIDDLMTILMSDTPDIVTNNSPLLEVLEDFPLLDVNSSDMDLVTDEEDADPDSDDEFWEDVKQPIQHISDKQFKDHFEIFKFDTNFKNSIDNNFVNNIENTSCPICLCDFQENDMILRNSSGHFLHEECGKNYYQQKSKEIPTCPFSRTNPLEKQDGIKSIELIKAEYKIELLTQRLKKIE